MRRSATRRGGNLRKSRPGGDEAGPVEAARSVTAVAAASHEAKTVEKDKMGIDFAPYCLPDAQLCAAAFSPFKISWAQLQLQTHLGYGML